MPHLQRVLQDGNELFDLTVVQNASGNSPLGGKTLQEVYPFRPFAVLGLLDLPARRIQRHRKLVFGNKVKGTPGQAIIDFREDTILLMNHQVGW